MRYPQCSSSREYILMRSKFLFKCSQRVDIEVTQDINNVKILTRFCCSETDTRRMIDYPSESNNSEIILY